MSQATLWNVPLAGPGTMSQFAGRLGPSLDAVLSNHSGASRPAYAVANQTWLKIVSGSVWEWYLFDGADDILIGTINTGANTFTLNSTGLGFATSLIARTDAVTLALCSGRVLLTRQSNGQGWIDLYGRSSGQYDDASLRFINGLSGSQKFRLNHSGSDDQLYLRNASDLVKCSFTQEGDVWSDTINGYLSDNVVQPGTIVFGPWVSAPPGLVTCNGALLSRTTFARLWAFAQTYGKIVSDSVWDGSTWGVFSTGDGSTTFRIPWFGGEFPRGVYDESVYTIGKRRSDANKAHDHGGETGYVNLAHTHSEIIPTIGYGGAGSTPQYNSLTGGTTGNASVSMNHAHSISSNGGTEAEPKNIALLACLKY